MIGLRTTSWRSAAGESDSRSKDSNREDLSCDGAQVVAVVYALFLWFELILWVPLPCSWAFDLPDGAHSGSHLPRNYEPN